MARRAKVTHESLAINQLPLTATDVSPGNNGSATDLTTPATDLTVTSKGAEALSTGERIRGQATTPTLGEGPEHGSKTPLSAADLADFRIPRSDVKGLSAAYLAELPLATTLTLVEATPEGYPVLITTSKAVAERGRAHGACVLTGGELECIARGVAAERVYAATARAWFERKRREPEWRITLALTLDAEDLAADRRTPDLITIGAVLRALRLELEHVAVERDPVPCLDSNANP